MANLQVKDIDDRLYESIRVLAANEEKIAYIDNSILLGESDIGIKTVEELEEKIKEFQNEVNVRENEIFCLNGAS